jgi:glycosyltransferase involved in cell wall biosynthesis
MKHLGVVIPTLNAGATLSQTLISLVPLRDAGATILVVDSYSTDDTLVIAKRFGVAHIEVPPGNMYNAINEGLKNLECDWLTYVNADDIVYHDAISSGLRNVALETEIIYGSIDFIDHSGRHLHSWNSPKPSRLARLMPIIMPFPQLGTCYRRSLFDRLQGFNVTYRYCADYDFFARALISGAHFKQLPFPRIGAFRLHERQITSLREREMKSESREIRRKMAASAAGYFSLGLQRLYNWDSYLVRVIRKKHLSGSFGLTKTVEH